MTTMLEASTFDVAPPTAARVSAWIDKEVHWQKEISRGETGADVRRIQEWLQCHGYFVKIDGEFGPATQRAVREFQKSVDLAESGGVDKETFEELVAPMVRALQLIGRTHPALGETVVAFAKQHLQQQPKEIGGENCGPWVRLYTRGHQGREYRWCAGFVSFLLQQAGDQMGTSSPLPYTLSCDLLASNAQASGRFIPEALLRKPETRKSLLAPGMIFLSRRTENDWTHTGIVVRVNAETFEAIEGNSNETTWGAGYEVCRRIRGYDSKDFIRLND